MSCETKTFCYSVCFHSQCCNKKKRFHSFVVELVTQYFDSWLCDEFVFVFAATKLLRKKTVYLPLSRVQLWRNQQTMTSRLLTRPPRHQVSLIIVETLQMHLFVNQWITIADKTSLQRAILLQYRFCDTWSSINSLIYTFGCFSFRASLVAVQNLSCNISRLIDMYLHFHCKLTSSFVSIDILSNLACH